MLEKNFVMILVPEQTQRVFVILSPQFFTPKVKTDMHKMLKMKSHYTTFL